MTTPDLIGSIAGTLTTLAFIPQVIKTWRSRSAADISLWMFALFSTGVLLWLTYGLLLGSLPIIVTNAITLALASTILALKLKWSWRERQRLAAAQQRPL